MSMKLFPRLEAEVARQLAKELADLDVSQARARSAIEHEATVFPPTGGVPVSGTDLSNLQERIRQVAGHHGYPATPSRLQQSSWDAGAALILHEHMGIAPAEAVNSGVWSFVACVLLPDLVRWRFGGERSSESRFLGSQRGIRNTFGRLWWRAEILGGSEEGEDGRRLARRYMALLGEDQLVQITERPAMSANRVLARAVAQSYLMYSEVSDVKAEDLMREAVKRVRRRLAFVCYEALNDLEIAQEVDGIFRDSVAALRDRWRGHDSSQFPRVSW